MLKEKKSKKLQTSKSGPSNSTKEISAKWTELGEKKLDLTAMKYELIEEEIKQKKAIFAIQNKKIEEGHQQKLKHAAKKHNLTLHLMKEEHELKVKGFNLGENSSYYLGLV